MIKGSQWNKWDLHVHTPFSILNNGFGNDWDVYVKELFTRAIKNNIISIGITDYFIIDGYKKLKTEYLENHNKLKELFTDEEINKISKILVLPNVEFRLNKLVGTNRINYHILFSNNVSIEDIEENFLHELDFIYESNPQGHDEKRKLKVRNLEALGCKLKEQHQHFRTKSDLEIGMMNAVVDDEQITNLLHNKSSIFKDNYFILLPCDEDLSKLSWNSQDHHTRKLLIQKADILIATNPNTIKWGLGLFNDTKEDYIKEFKSIKPCIGGSDSHNFEELFIKNEERSTWIKADVCFEGLRQIIVEAGQRVHLSKDEPFAKDDKNIIEEIKIISSDKLFTDKSLFLNDNLNVIIGGKSSGKSILLYNIARTLFQDNSEHSLLKSYNPDIRKEEFKYEFGGDFDFIVKLKSGSTQSIKRSTDVPSILPNIKYIPQNYLSELAEKKFKRNNELNKLVRELILEDSESDKEYSQFLSNVKQNDKLRESLINNYFSIIDDIKELREKLIKIGNKDALQQSISNSANAIDLLKKEAGFDDEENKSFDQLKESDKALKVQEANIKDDWRKTRNYNSELLSTVNELLSKNELFINSLNEPEIKDFYNAKYSIIQILRNKLLEVDNEVLLNEQNQLVNDSIFRTKLSGITRGLSENSEKLKPFNLKIEISNKINSIQTSQQEDEKKLNNIINIEKEIKLKEEGLENQFNKIFDLYRKTFDEYISIINKLESRINTLEDENLQIKGVVKFNYNKFNEIFIGISNSTSKSYDAFGVFKLDNSSNLNFESHIIDIEEIFKKVVTNNYVLRKQTSPQQAIKTY